MARRFVSSSSQNLRDSTWADLAYYNKFTISVWLKRASSGSTIGAGSFYNIFNRAFVKLNGSGNVELGHSAGDFTEISSCALSGTDWHHLFFVFDGTLSGNANRVKLWVDGVQQTLSFGGAGAPSSMGPNLDDWEIGSEGGTYHNGDVALCFVWRGVAHGETQAQEYAAQTADETTYTTGLRGAWLLDETTSTDDAADSSGNSSTLVQSGSPEWVADPDPIGGGPTDVPASDPPTVSIDDAAAVAVAPAVTDTPTVGISDSAAVAVAQERSDDATVGITDEAAFAVNVPVSDTPTVSISDSAALVPAVAASDPPTVSVDDTAAVAVSFAVSDDVTVSVDDSASLETPGLESKSGSDAITVSLDDATSALAAVLSRTDDVTTGVDDVAAVAVAQARSDDVSVSISDSATVAEFVSVAVTDSVSVSITDAKDALAAFLAVADESTIAITDDVGGIAVPFALTDTVGVSVGDVSSLYTGDVLVAARSRSATIPREPRSLTVPRARRSFDA